MAESQHGTSLLPSLPGLSVISPLFSRFQSATSPLTPLPEVDETSNSSSRRSESSAAAAPISAEALPSHPQSKVHPTINNNSKHQDATMFNNYSKIKESVSEDNSREGSFVSGEGAEGRKRKRTSKPKTSYTICRAPPKSCTRSKIQVRARPLLQLQKLEAQDRPKPAFEVLPYAIFSGKLAKAVNKVFGAKHSPTPTDLVIVRAEEYHGKDEDETRDVLALICGAGRKDSNASTKVKILLANGTEWESYQLPNGSYESCSTDDHGLKQTVRWVRKKTSTKSVDSTAETAAAVERKFNFSTISSNTRRHPVIANLTSKNLDVYNVYNVPAPTAQTFEEGEQSGESKKTTEEMREIITATAVTVAIREGWCPSYRSEESLARSSSLRSVTSSFASPPGSPAKLSDNASLQRSSTLKSLMRAPSLLSRNPRPKSSDSSASHPVLGSAMSSALSLESAPARRRARADTTSTVIMNDNAAQWRPDFVDGPQEDDLEEDDEEEEEDDKENDAPNHNDLRRDSVSAPDLTATSVPEKPSLRVHKSMSWCKSQTSSLLTDASKFDEKKPAPVAAPQPKQKKGFLSTLFCGMV